MTEKQSCVAKIAIIIGLYLIVQVLAGAVALVAGNWNNLMAGQPLDKNALMGDARWVGIALFCGNLIMMVLMWAFRLVRRNLLPTPPAGTLHGWGWGIVAFFLVVFGVNGVFSPLDLSDGGTTQMFQGMADNPICFLSLTLIGPIAEEFVFREGIQRHLVASKVPMKWAIIISAALFSVAHLNLAQSVPAFFLGYALGILYARTGDIRLSAAAHVLNNTLAVLLFQVSEADDLTKIVGVYPLIIVSSVLLISGIFLFTYWWKRSEPQNNTPAIG